MTAPFTTLGEATQRVVSGLAFLRALDQGVLSIVDSMPPIEGFQSIGDDEDYILAQTFALLCRPSLAGSATAQMAFLGSTIEVHRRRAKLAWDNAPGNNDPRRTADRSAWVALRPYEAMIGVMQDWLDALHQRACEDIRLSDGKSFPIIERLEA